MKNQTKQKRLKTVFSSQQKVAALWIAQSQPEARTKFCSFSGPDLYICGRHAGRIVTYNGVRIALRINDVEFCYSAYGTDRAFFHGVTKESKTVVIGVDEIDEKLECIEKYMLQSQSDILDSLINRLCGERYWRDSTNVFNRECDLLGFKYLKIEPPKGFFAESDKLERRREKARRDLWRRQAQHLFESNTVLNKLNIGRTALENFQSRSVE